MTTDLERQTVVLWKGGAAQLFFGRCDDCRRVEGDDGKPLLVARQERSPKFQCLDCYSLKPSCRRSRG